MENILKSALKKNQQRTEARPAKSERKDVDGYLSEIRAFESDRVAMAKHSAKTAWKVAMGAGAVAILSLVAVVTMLPLKTSEPYLIKVDRSTGSTDVVHPLRDGKGASYGEVLDKYWIDQFIVARDGYEWETIQTSFNTMKLMTTPKTFGAYSQTVVGKNSLTKVFVDQKSMRIDVQDISFLPSTNGEEKLAQVRFVRHVMNNHGEDDKEYKPTYWTATLSYDYRSTIRTENERRLNPLGFRVTSYREDQIIK